MSKRPMHEFWDLTPAQVAFQVDDWVKRNSPQPKQRKGTATDLMAIFGRGPGMRTHNKEALDKAKPGAA